jgi:hypothetical protein
MLSYALFAICEAQAVSRHKHPNPTMIHNQFHIGLSFWCGGKRWRCTDVGSRTIVAISLEPHETVRSQIDRSNPLKRVETRSMTDHVSWLGGPPYAIVEQVFDEDSIIGCALTVEDDDSISTLSELQNLIDQECVDIERYFKSIHHFSQQPPFSTDPSSFKIFSEYVASQANGIKGGGENERTIQRARTFVQLMRSTSSEEALRQAWILFPLIRITQKAASSDE